MLRTTRTSHDLYDKNDRRYGSGDSRSSVAFPSKASAASRSMMNSASSAFAPSATRILVGRMFSEAGVLVWILFYVVKLNAFSTIFTVLDVGPLILT